MEDRSRVFRLHPGCPDRPRRHVPEQGTVEDSDEGAQVLIQSSY